tara:strand:+ start:22 stop:201 length:180 start_codon:yes stop_codon:yes gene_type:complete
MAFILTILAEEIDTIRKVAEALELDMEEVEKMRDQRIVTVAIRSYLQISQDRALMVPIL